MTDEKDDTGNETAPRGDGPIVVRRGTIGRFRIDADLGEGGMADVYRAYDPVLDRAVALKVLHSTYATGETGVRRVLREARAAAALTHPNTVTIFEVGEADGKVFIAMELLEGAVLREVIDRGQSSLEEKLRWMQQAARALAAAHERGLVHRDVKPENMFVCASGVLKLLDFGIAKRDEHEGTIEGGERTPSSLRTQPGRRLGTPRYMAPEQHAGLPTDPRTDQYAWGLVAFELICGSQVAEEQPTKTSEGGVAPPGATSAMRLTELQAKAPDLAPAVAASIARALEPAKDDRFPSMAPILLAFENGTPTPSVAPRKRPRWLVPVGAAIVAVTTLAALRPLLSVDERAATTKPATDATRPLACRTVSSRSLPLGEQDWLVVMPDGAVVIARDPKQGFRLEREDGSGVVALPRLSPPSDPLVPVPGFWAHGMMFHEIPSVFAVTLTDALHAGDRGWSVVVARSGGALTIGALKLEPKDVAATSFGDTIAVVIASTTNNDSPTPQVTVRLVDEERIVTIEEGFAHYATAAAAEGRLAVAYARSTGGTRFALFDRGLRRIGDVMTAVPARTKSAIAFAGTTAVIYWTDTGAKRRLHSATFTPGDAAFSAAKVAVEDPVVDQRPIGARRNDGTFLLGWLTSEGGSMTLRVSPVGPGGALTGPSDVATAPAFLGLEATPTAEGVDFSWISGNGTGHIARVVCQPPTSLPDR